MVEGIMNMKRLLTFVQIILAAFLLAACGPEAEPIASEPEVVTVDGQQPEPTETPVPPTNTPEPPTSTPEPLTPTVEPTATPVPPTATAEPPTPTPGSDLAEEDLFGYWAQLLFTLELNPDGTYVIVWPAEPGDEQPKEFGTYVLANGSLTFRPESYELTGATSIDGCDDGTVYTYTASFSDRDPRFLKLVVSGSDNCGYRAHQWSQEPVWQLLEKYSAE
jgi:hypothetical protein